MKKLNKIVLNKAKEMTAPQMKNITGGYYGVTGCLSQCMGTCDKGWGVVGACTTKFSTDGSTRCVCD